MLDLCCCQGGAAKGFLRAGFTHVVGVDTEDHSARYVGTDFVQADAIKFVLKYGHMFDAIHASWPCQAYSQGTAGNPKARAKHPRLIAAGREAMLKAGKPYTIENVERARPELRNPVLLCGRMFGLEADDEDGERLYLDRHRLFESNVPLVTPLHPHHHGQVAGVYGGGRRAKRLPGESLAEVAPRDRYAARVERGGGYTPRSRRVQEELLGIDWMTVKGMQESIPPIYAEYVGRQILEAIS